MTRIQAVRVLGRDRDDPPRAACAHARAHATPIQLVPYHPLKKRIKIEDLLVWAYREEMVHAARPEGMPAECMGGGGSPRLGFGSGFETECVETSFNFGFGAAADAYRVHRAVSALGPVEVRMAVGEVGVEHSIDMARGAMPEVERSFVVKRASLVITCAIDGRAPDWIDRPSLIVERGELLYQRDRKGRILRDVRGRALELMQLVSFIGDMPWAVAKARRIYGVWHHALWALIAALNDAGLERFTLTDEMPLRAPWGVQGA
jgi:hypothetical protein